MESLKKLSDMFLTTAESSKDYSWKNSAKNTPQHPVPVQQMQTPFSLLSPTEQYTPTFKNPIQPEIEPTEETQPKRLAREVAALENTSIIGNNASPSRNTRSERTTIAALTLLSALQGIGL